MLIVTIYNIYQSGRCEVSEVLLCKADITTTLR